MDVQHAIWAKIGQLWLRVVELEHEVSALRAQLPPAEPPTLTIVGGGKKESSDG